MPPWLQEITRVFQEEFSDLPTLEGVTRICIRLVSAALLGGVLGFEREQEGKSAGLRTHMIVALGAALFVLVPQQAGVSDADLTRVLQGLVAGVGFLGAGTIIKGQDTDKVKGLTTAANIWLTAAVGMAAGMGREATALVCTALAFAILATVPRFSKLFQQRKGKQNFDARNNENENKSEEPKVGQDGVIQ
jgi:putative Mg2+ transporter-C (MgtC) family protein